MDVVVQVPRTDSLTSHVHFIKFPTSNSTASAPTEKNTCFSIEVTLGRSTCRDSDALLLFTLNKRALQTPCLCT
ncbi:hypothetical protein EYC84_006796 [Monilinia fructicola]|uniref:Uncharacterized protein n=1 Tax=Monilinia fructicola TaxID=38448 RepID=A0A5M9K903_MONFR|nr:hypothetical protein EYC84_006796 [Monilinia fructicola]